MLYEFFSATWRVMPCFFWVLAIWVFWLVRLVLQAKRQNRRPELLAFSVSLVSYVLAWLFLLPIFASVKFSTERGELLKFQNDIQRKLTTLAHGDEPDRKRSFRELLDGDKRTDEALVNIARGKFISSQDTSKEEYVGWPEAMLYLRGTPEGVQLALDYARSSANPIDGRIVVLEAFERTPRPGTAEVIESILKEEKPDLTEAAKKLKAK